MLSFLPQCGPNGDFPVVFNNKDWSFVSDYYVTFGDILNYAQLSVSNLWTASQVFSDGFSFSGNINQVSATAFSYLQNVTSDNIQSQFQSIVTLLVNWSTDATSNTNLINGLNTAIAGGVNSNALIANTGVVGSFTATIAHIGSLSIGSLFNPSVLPLTCVWLWNNERRMMYPLQSTTTIDQLTLWNNNQSMRMTVLPNIEVVFLDSSGICLWSFWNTLDTTQHFVSINFPEGSNSLATVQVIRH
jgi:hypothetical protein